MEEGDREVEVEVEVDVCGREEEDSSSATDINQSINESINGINRG